MDIVNQCRHMFCFDIPSVMLAGRTGKFMSRLTHCDNYMIKYVISIIIRFICFKTQHHKKTLPYLMYYAALFIGLRVVLLRCHVFVFLCCRLVLPTFW